MKKVALHIFAILFAIMPNTSLCQGTFVYDQQSADETAGGVGAVINSNQPIGQSFTPTLSSVGFIRLFLSDSSLNGVGASVYVNLRQGSITGPILASTDPVSMPDSFSGHPDFLFSTPVSVTPGTTYFFQPVLQAGDSTWSIVGYNYNYDGGTAFIQGNPNIGSDVWFREGIIIPEPSGVWLILLGIGIFVWRRRRWHNS